MACSTLSKIRGFWTFLNPTQKMPTVSATSDPFCSEDQSRPSSHGTRAGLPKLKASPAFTPQVRNPVTSVATSQVDLIAVSLLIQAYCSNRSNLQFSQFTRNPKSSECVGHAFHSCALRSILEICLVGTSD